MAISNCYIIEEESQCYLDTHCSLITAMLLAANLEQSPPLARVVSGALLLEVIVGYNTLACA